MEKVAEIKLTNGNKIVIEKNNWSDDYPTEAVVTLQNEKNEYIQDICLIRQHSDVRTDKIISDDIDVLVWAESDNEDYTDKFVINQYKEDED